MPSRIHVLTSTVPNAARRFARQQVSSQRLVAQGQLEAGDILYERTSHDLAVRMYYHLYTLQEFEQELEQQGFRLIRLEAVRDKGEGWLMTTFSQLA